MPNQNYAKGHRGLQTRTGADRNRSRNVQKGAERELAPNLQELGEYPKYVCEKCAVKGGGKIPAHHIACWHMDICPCCGHLRAVTKPRDYGYPKIKVSFEYKKATKELVR